MTTLSSGLIFPKTQGLRDNLKLCSKPRSSLDGFVMTVSE